MPAHENRAAGLGSETLGVTRRRCVRRVALAALASLGLAASLPACAPQTNAPAASAQAPQLSSVADALSHHRERYEVGWLTASGEVTYSDVTAVAVENDGTVRLELSEPSLIWGTTGPRTLQGHWQDSVGKGELWLEFAGDYATAKGWWNHGGSSERRQLWLRLSSGDKASGDPASGH